MVNGLAAASEVGGEGASEVPGSLLGPCRPSRLSQSPAGSACSPVRRNLPFQQSTLAGMQLLLALSPPYKLIQGVRQAVEGRQSAAHVQLSVQLQVAVTYVLTAPPISGTMEHLHDSSSNSSTCSRQNNSSSNSGSGRRQSNNSSGNSSCTCAALCSTALC